MASTPSILLVACNARYGHCAYAARSLAASLAEHGLAASILETDLDVQPFQLAAEIVSRQPRVCGFSVYLWNVRQVRETLAILQRVAPGVRIVLGGPEIVPGCECVWRGLADDLVAGEGELAFRELCGQAVGAPVAECRAQLPKSAGSTPRLVVAPPPALTDLALPYDLYSDEDLAHRTLYAEGTRGCPFTCAYCSSAGSALRAFPPERLLPALDRLLARGARALRFLDRSLNADEPQACALLDFFLARHPGRVRLHFEIMPCRLGNGLRERLAAFPAGSLHLEVGVQTLHEPAARAVGRRTPTAVVLETLQFLARDTRATVHADLIFGLPGEDERTFAAGFDLLVRTFDFPELQVNLLKRLPGTPLACAPQFAGLVFNPHPPYELLASDALDFDAIVRLQGFARCWELVHNRGRFPRAAASLWQGDGVSPYARYLALSQRILAAEGRLHALGAERLAGHLAGFLATDGRLPGAEIEALLAADRG
jgi:radical SAM superfamily enzyme YgiQ (UPF0313 family)